MAETTDTTSTTDDYSNNKQTNNGLSIVYSYTSKMVNIGGETITGTSVDKWVPLYCVTRTATKDYSYVGLTKDEATALAQAKVQQYTRIYKGWRYGSEHIEYVDYSYCGAHCAPVHQEAHLWSCQIQVNERDDVWTFSLSTNPWTGQAISDISDFFSYIDQDYDED